jgi:hypothetical protein
MTKPIVGNHPNATTAALAGSITVILIWIVGVAGLAVPAEVGSAFTTIVAAIILGLGRRRPSTGAVDGTAVETVST